MRQTIAAAAPCADENTCMRKGRRRCTPVAAALILSFAAASSSAGTIESGASVLIFQRVVVDGSRDTTIQLSNVAGRVTRARCHYANSAGQVGDEFFLALIGRQPTHWVVSRGRAVNPDDGPCNRGAPMDCDGAGLDPGLVPPLAQFSGALVCVQVDLSDAPLSGNALRGVATVTATDSGDIAKYRAVGLLGLDTNNADDVLCIEGENIPGCTEAEYSGCPHDDALLHLADDAPDALAPDRLRVQTSLTTVPCAAALGGGLANSALHLAASNELAQTFSADVSSLGGTPQRLSELSAQLTRATLGTDAALTSLTSGGAAGFVAVSETARVGLDDSVGGRTAAAVGDMGGAALVTFPRVSVDSTEGTDTVFQLANHSDQPLDVLCTYEDFTPRCTSGLPGESCTTNPPICTGDCFVSSARQLFHLPLAASQPLSWRAGIGLARAAAGELPAITVPAVSDPFRGDLRCVAVDAHDVPVERNALLGTATVETIEQDPAAVDAAQYAAIGLQALPGAVNDDAYLVIGGPAPEYESCGDILDLPVVFDGAVVRTGNRSDVSYTDLTLVPCASEWRDGAMGGGVAQYLVYNEFRQRFSTGRQFGGQFTSQLSLIDTDQTDRSIFSTGVEGTLSGTVRIQGAGSGLYGVAFERRGGSVRSSAAIDLFRTGHQSEERDLQVLPLPLCPGDCDGGGSVTVSELISAVNLALGDLGGLSCAAVDTDSDGRVSIAELVQAVARALNGCGELPSPPPTPNRPTPTPVITPAIPGPDITYFGIVTADDTPIEPDTVDEAGRPVYTRPRGEGFALVVEARPGSDRARVGSSTFVPGGATLPDLQMVVSRPLGDGSATVCDALLPTQGGVPAAEPFGFESAQAIAAVNDLGCRADGGSGEPRGAPSSVCSRLTDAQGFFADSSQQQFCTPIAQAWPFPPGDTIVRVRVRSVQGSIGLTRELVVRVAE